MRLDTVAHSNGIKFLQDLARIICRESHTEWEWDDSRKPACFRLTIKGKDTQLTFQIDGQTLAERDGEAYRDFCAEVLRRCLETFRPDLRTV